MICADVTQVKRMGKENMNKSPFSGMIKRKRGFTNE